MWQWHVHNAPVQNDAFNNRYPRKLGRGPSKVTTYRSPNRGKPIFTVAWRAVQNRFRRCFADEIQARAFAEEKFQTLLKNENEAVPYREVDAMVYRAAVKVLGDSVPVHVAAGEYAAAIRTLNGTGTLLQATEFFARYRTVVDVERTVPEVVAEMVHAKERDGLSVRYLEDCRDRLGRFATDFKRPISLLQTRDIAHWLRELQCSTRSRNNYRNLIVTLFSFARKHGYYPADRPNPAALTDRAKERGPSICIFTSAELAEMLAVAVDHERIAIALGAFAGIRQAEILRLRWENFNWSEQVIDLGCDQTKTASRRLAPILPALHDWISSHRKMRGPVMPFNEDTGFHRFYKSIVAKVNAARSPDLRDFAWKPNGLRHSYASYRLAIIQDTAQLALEMGNSPAKIFSNYRRVVTKSQAQAWFNIVRELPANVIRFNEMLGYA